MLSLATLLARHRTLLLVDTASLRVQILLFSGDGSVVSKSSEAEAAVALFDTVREALTEAGRSLSEIEAFAFCEGPGSILSLRTAAMALRTWQALGAPRPVYAYRSLELLAAALATGGRAGPFSVACDARRGLWHVLSVDAAGEAAPLGRVTAEALAALPGALLEPSPFRRWAQPPRPLESASYSIYPCLSAAERAPLFRETSEPDALALDLPEYRKWSAERHRAPDPLPRPA